ncbi:ATG16 family protein [Streptococcus suis]|uniref:ATG16 family protein n=1 Tax=Streptococcus suis TaxID=1307 RepID=UPI00209BB6A9|nr:ATG16 family protein [Streptococcus suis]MCO8213056.1 ATG16 family protein [Streptococcus suis]HEM3437898.1 hypothetical protein [Streptococcus suis]
MLSKLFRTNQVDSYGIDLPTKTIDRLERENAILRGMVNDLDKENCEYRRVNQQLVDEIARLQRIAEKEEILGGAYG